jgi:hypothetical protein
MHTYRTLGAALGWFALLTQYYLNTTQSGLLPGSVIYFSFFTLWGNILVAVAFTVPLLPGTAPDAFFARPGVRTALGVYILIIALIFYLMLRNLYHPTGLGWWDNTFLHYIIPPLYLFDWLLFVPKCTLRFHQIPAWLILPLTFAAYTLLHGALSGYYPYPFLNVRTFGYPQILLNIAGLTLLFILTSAAFIGTGRMLPQPEKR